MPMIGYRNFAGEIPKESPDLLPEARAQLAMNCDFSNGKLRSIKGGSALQAMVNNPVKGIYTEDGILFYTWSAETIAYKSPVIDDAYGRMFYLTPSVGVFKVATTVGMAFNGPTPSSPYSVGVPRPTVAPSLKTIERNTLPDYQNATFTANAWWDYGGTKYSEAAVTLTTTTALRVFTFSAPAKPGTPPTGITGVLVTQLIVKDPDNSNAVLMDLTIRSGSNAQSRVFPGTVEAAVTIASTNTATIRLTWGAEGARAYTYTYRNTWLEESAPAPPATISPTYVQDVLVGVTAGNFTNYRPFDAYQIYRTYGNNTTYLKTDVGGVPLTFTDASRTPTTIGQALQTTDWLPPPTGLAGLVLTPGGWFAAFKGNVLYKSAPYRPYAWPYSETFQSVIRGIAVSESGLIVTTADGVYIVPGDPAKSGPFKPSTPQAGLSQRSMAQVDGAVAYASNDGIVLVEGSVASIEASQRLFNRETWRTRYSDILDDASLRLSYHDGMIYGTSHTQAKGFLLKLDEDVGTFTRTEERVDATFQLPVADALFYSVGATVYRFQGGSNLTFDWWGRDWVMPYDVSMGAGYIRTTGSITVKIYADDVLWYSATMTTGFFRIPPRRALKWSVRLGGTGTVHQFQMAQGMGELKNGG